MIFEVAIVIVGIVWILLAYNQNMTGNMII